MKRSVLAKVLVCILIIEIAVLTGIIIFNRQSEAPSVKGVQPVIKGDVVNDLKTTEDEKNNLQDEEDSSDLTDTEKDPQNVGTENINEIQSQLETLINTEYMAGGNVAVCTGRVDENEMAMVNGGPMQAASLIKLYVAGCVYENYGVVSAYDSYSGETESLLSVMITVSDNTACNTLVTRLGNGNVQTGMALVNQYCANHGFADTHMGRLMLQSNDVDDNYTSVRDCCNYLKMASAGQLEGSASVLNYMNQQQRRSKIPAGIPSGVTVGNKTGELGDVENDAAIVYSNSGTYVLCVMSEYLSDTYTAQQFITKISSVVYEMM